MIWCCWLMDQERSLKRDCTSLLRIVRVRATFQSSGEATITLGGMFG